MDINKKKDDIKRIDGTNFGVPTLGMYDLPITFLQKLLARHIQEMRQNKDKKNDFIFALNSINMADTVVAFLLNLSSKTDISPKGMISLLSFIHDSIYNEYKNIMQKVFKNCVKVLCAFIRETQLLSIQEWPGSGGGGA